MARLIPLPGFWRFAGTGIFRAPERYSPVMELRGSAQISSAVPWATTSPPWTLRRRGRCPRYSPPRAWCPRRAPRLGACCPGRAARLSVFMSLPLSRWCRPMLGSSRIYSTPMSPEPICVARRMRCALAARKRRRRTRQRQVLQSPTLDQESPDGTFSSFRMPGGHRPLACAVLQRQMASMKSLIPRDGQIARSSMMLTCRPRVTARASGRSGACRGRSGRGTRPPYIARIPRALWTFRSASRGSAAPGEFTQAFERACQSVPVRRCCRHIFAPRSGSPPVPYRMTCRDLFGQVLDGRIHELKVDIFRPGRRNTFW